MNTAATQSGPSDPSSTRPVANLTTGRLAYLDWLRVGAFALLIVYHVGMIYWPWPFHIKSEQVIPELTFVMNMINPWRLTLLFFISGAASRFLIDKIGPKTFARSRILRLGPPLLIGLFILIPPQAYIEVASKLQYSGSFLEFWPLYLSGSDQFVIDGAPLAMPSWNHLWFVVYLLAYTLALAALAFSGVLKPAFAWWSRQGKWADYTLIAGAVGLAFLCRWLLFPIFGYQLKFFEDGYLHALFISAFAMGVLAAKRTSFWPLLGRFWFVFAGVAAVASVSGVVLARIGFFDAGYWATDAFYALLYVTYAWGVIFALVGAAYHWLNRYGPRLALLNRAIFPLYVFHQTVMILAAAVIVAWQLPVAVEALLILIVTISGSVALTALVMMWNPSRMAFGLKPKPELVAQEARA